jgi:dihydroxyacid dehydratase/phosphogluconate dehydratase
MVASIQRTACGINDAGHYDEFMQMVSSSAPSVGHCNTMGTATSMNSLAETLGVSLPGCAAIPAPYRERGWMAYETGKRIVGLVQENLRPSDIMTKQAFENAVVAADAMLADYKTVLLSDGNATMTDEEHAAALNTFMMFFGDVMRTCEAVERMTA